MDYTVKNYSYYNPIIRIYSDSVIPGDVSVIKNGRIRRSDRLLNVAEARLALSSPILGWEVAFYMGIGAGRMSDESGRQPIRHIPDKNIMCMIQSFVSVELGGSRCSRARHLANSLWQMRSGNCAR